MSQKISPLVLLVDRLRDSLITRREVADCASPFIGQCTMNQLSSGGNVLVFLNKSHWILSGPAVNSTFPWSLQFTANSYSQKSLSRKEHWDYLDEAADTGRPDSGQLWVMFGQMTPITTTPLDLARPLNPVLGAKMYESWSLKKLNIIAYDYIGKFSHNRKSIAKLIWQSNVLQVR